MKTRGLLVLAALLAVAPSGPGGADTGGPATVIDGETIVVGAQRYRLHGIDAPDIRQTCEIRGRIYACGNVSRAALMDLVVGTPVTCRPLAGQPLAGPARQRRAICRAGGYDLSEGMVHTGWALAVPREGTKYARIERQAERAKRGLWQGRFALPWEWKP